MYKKLQKIIKDSEYNKKGKRPEKIRTVVNKEKKKKRKKEKNLSLIKNQLRRIKKLSRLDLSLVQSLRFEMPLHHRELLL